MVWIFLMVVMLALAWVGVLVQRRRRAQREAEEARAMAFMLEHAARREAAAAAVPVDADAPPSVQADRSVPPPPAPARPHGGSGRAYLDDARARAYRRLKQALPAYEVFPRGSLRRAAGLDSIERDMLLDFVICTRALAPVAAVDLDRGSRPTGEGIKRQVLGQAGVRYACWSVDAMPEAADVQAWLR